MLIFSLSSFVTQVEATLFESYPRRRSYPQPFSRNSALRGISNLHPLTSHARSSRIPSKLALFPPNFRRIRSYPHLELQRPLERGWYPISRKLCHRSSFLWESLGMCPSLQIFRFYSCSSCDSLLETLTSFEGLACRLSLFLSVLVHLRRELEQQTWSFNDEIPLIHPLFVIFSERLYQQGMHQHRLILELSFF